MTNPNEDSNQAVISEISDVPIEESEGVGALLAASPEASSEEEDIKDSEKSAAEDIRTTIRGLLQVVEASIVDNVPEPQIVFSNPRAIIQQEDTLRFISAVLDVEYFPEDHYLDDGYLEEYLNQLARLPLNVETYLKIVFSDFVQVLNPAGLSVRLTYTDLGMSTKVLTLSTEYTSEASNEVVEDTAEIITSKTDRDNSSQALIDNVNEERASRGEEPLSKGEEEDLVTLASTPS